jgi:hypothetical protein
LQSSAIFFSWNDAKPFFTVGSGSGIIGDDEEGKETDGTTNCIDVNRNVNYQTFSTIDEAVQYLAGKHDNNYISDSDSNGKKRKTSAITLTTKTSFPTTTATTRTPTTTTTNPKRQRRHKKVLLLLLLLPSKLHSLGM